MIDRSRRRIVIVSLATLGLGALAPASRAAGLVLTPRQTRGPFYPEALPLDSDSDLATVEGRGAGAAGEITHVVGRVLDEGGRAVPSARIEIWQCNAYGRYHHPWDRRDAPLDPGFQGYGRAVTGPSGGYHFRTIKPVPYGYRAPHIHFAVSGPGFEPLVTQMYVEGAPENARDGILNRIRDERVRRSVIVPIEPHPEIPGELLGTFDIVLAGDGRYAD